MAIILDPSNYGAEHKLLIKAVEASTMAPWIKKSLITRIQNDLDRLKEQQNHDHEFHDYVGERRSCSCGSIEVGSGIGWTLKEFLDRGIADKPADLSAE